MQKYLVWIAALFLGMKGMAQWQAGIFTGIANYQGDLTDQPYRASRGVFGLTAGYQLTPRINLRAGLSFAKVAGADSLNKSELRLRNLSFQSHITELSVVGEFNTFDLSER